MQSERAAIEQAWQQAAGRCQCQAGGHKHAGGRCGRQLTWVNRGMYGEGAWEAQRLPAQDAGYRILCWDCHAKLS